MLTTECTFDIMAIDKQMFDKEEVFHMNRKKLYIMFASLFFVTVMTFLAFHMKEVKASDGISREKCVSTIKVEEGDTIWSIARTYYTSEYKDINELIKEIKKSNHIDENIFIGQYIIVPHYEELS